jgi:hypothetical protein
MAFFLCYRQQGVKMIGKRVSWWGVGAALLLIALWWLRPLSIPQDNNLTIRLQPPPVLAENTAVASFLDNEAGIAAYTQLPVTIDNFFHVRSLFRTIELETDSYIISSIQATGYGEPHDVHVYIHEDGWVLAYYLRTDPTGKIFNWVAYNGTAVPTKLENVINTVANALQTVAPSPDFYHFRYPEATHLMFVVDSTGNGTTDTFQVNLPGLFNYSERSWFAGSYGDIVTISSYWLNGELLYQEPAASTSRWGLLTEQQLPPGVFHTFQLSQTTFSLCNASCRIVAGLVLVYQEEP